MSRKALTLLLASLVILVIGSYSTFVTFTGAGKSGSGSGCGISLVQKIILPNASGRIDHMDVDTLTGKLFVAMLGNNSLAVMDLNQGKFVESIAGLQEPQGVLFLPSANRVLVTNGGNGIVDVYDSTTLKQTGAMQLGSDADNIRYDASSGLVYVGYGHGGVAALNIADARVVGSVALFGHPESFQLDRNDSEVFVNVPAGSYIAVIDRNTSSIIARWPLPLNVVQNFPMALDEVHHRLFVGARQPAKVLVYDTAFGKLITTIDIAQGPDDIFFTPTGCLYVSSTQGTTYVLRQTDPDHYSIQFTVPTGSGAGTSLYLPQFNRLYVAIPQGQAGSPAEIDVYQAGINS